MKNIECFLFSNDFFKPKRNVFQKTSFQAQVETKVTDSTLGDLEHKDQFKAQTVDFKQDSFDIRLNTSEGKAGPRNLYELLQQGFEKNGKKTTEVLRKLSSAGFETYKSYEGERFTLENGKLSLYRNAENVPWYTWDLNQSDDVMKKEFHEFVAKETKREARTNLRYIQEEVEPARGKKDALAKWREGLLKETESNSIVGVRRSLAKALGKTDLKAIEEFVSFKARKTDWEKEVVPHLDKLKTALKTRLPKMDATKIDAVTDKDPYTGSSIQNLLFIEYYRLWEEVIPTNPEKKQDIREVPPPRSSQRGTQNPERERPERSRVDY